MAQVPGKEPGRSRRARQLRQADSARQGALIARAVESIRSIHDGCPVGRVSGIWPTYSYIAASSRCHSWRYLEATFGQSCPQPSLGWNTTSGGAGNRRVCYLYTTGGPTIMEPFRFDLLELQHPCHAAQPLPPTQGSPPDMLCLTHKGGPRWLKERAPRHRLRTYTECSSPWVVNNAYKPKPRERPALVSPTSRQFHGLFRRSGVAMLAGTPCRCIACSSGVGSLPDQVPAVL